MTNRPTIQNAINHNIPSCINCKRLKIIQSGGAVKMRCSKDVISYSDGWLYNPYQSVPKIMLLQPVECVRRGLYQDMRS